MVSRACIIIHARWLVVFVVLVLSSSLSPWFPGHVLIHAHWCPLRRIACHRCINVIKPSSSASPSSCHLSRLVFVSSRLAVCVSYRVVLSSRLFLSRLVSPPRLCLSRLVPSCLVMSWSLSVSCLAVSGRIMCLCLSVVVVVCVFVFGSSEWMYSVFNWHNP